MEYPINCSCLSIYNDLQSTSHRILALLSYTKVVRTAAVRSIYAAEISHIRHPSTPPASRHVVPLYSVL